MLRLRKSRLTFALPALMAVLLSVYAVGQDDPNDQPLGDVARSLRKKTPQGVIDDDNLTQVMNEAEGRHPSGAGLKFLMAGDMRGFQVSAPDATCSLSFSANAKALLSSQYAQMELPLTEVAKLEGPAAIEGDALTISVINGTDWHVSEVDVALTLVKKTAIRDVSLSDPSTAYGSARLLSAVAGNPLQESEVRPEKNQDVTVIYRMRAAAPPFSRTVFSAPLKADLAPGEEWHWAIVQAKGYPPQSGKSNSSQATAQTSPAPAQIPLSQMLPDQPTVPPSLLAPPDSQGTLPPQAPH